MDRKVNLPGCTFLNAGSQSKSAWLSLPQMLDPKVRQFLDFNMSSVAQGHLRTNHVFKILSYQGEAEVTKTSIPMSHSFGKGYDMVNKNDRF